MSVVRRVHIDTDPGLDDLLALAFALASPELHLVSLATVAGNASLDAVTENARRFLHLAGLDVPVGPGAAGPLSHAAVHAEHVHGGDGRGGIELPPAHTPGGPLPSALEVLRDSVRERGADLVVALGPLTNLAHAVRDDAQLLRGVEVVWMGGTLSQGNVTPSAEFNCYADPEAADLVLGAGLELRVIGLDVTRNAALREADLADVPLRASALGRVLAELIDALMTAELPLRGERCATLHDPCAIAAAARRDLFRYERRSLVADTGDGHERGRLRQVAPAQRPGVFYAEEVNSAALLPLFTSRLSEWAGGLAAASAGGAR